MKISKLALYTVLVEATGSTMNSIAKPGDKKFTMDNVKYNPKRDGKIFPVYFRYKQNV